MSFSSEDANKNQRLFTLFFKVAPFSKSKVPCYMFPGISWNLRIHSYIYWDMIKDKLHKKIKNPTHEGCPCISLQYRTAKMDVPKQREGSRSQSYGQPNSLCFFLNSDDGLQPQTKQPHLFGISKRDNNGCKGGSTWLDLKLLCLLPVLQWDSLFVCLMYSAVCIYWILTVMLLLTLLF